MRISGAIDLKLRLALRVATLAAFSFLAAAAYVVFDSDRSARANAEATAEIVAKDLELQQSQIHWAKPANDPFPDLLRTANALMAPGMCIGYRSTNGGVVQRLCSGTLSDQTDAPAIFAALYRSAFGAGTEGVRTVLDEGRPRGSAVVTIDAARLIGDAWRETGRLLGLMAVVLSALCVMVYAALARALRPTGVIVAGLERLAANDLSARLPAFDLAELSAIRDVFNSLAETLQTTLVERNELTKRLIAVQDEERLHLARELHDEFGQRLAAISALAASAGLTAKDECPALLPECRSISQAAAHMMETLRGALVRLRAPDVEELGLASSLESLVAGWNGRSKGRTRFEIEVCGDLDGLPSSLGASLYRIAQEAITNAAKHAEATRIGLHLRVGQGVDAAADPRAREIELTVDDNGKGADIDVTTKSGMGLLGMRERIAALGGRLQFETRRPTGLILHAMIPAPQIAKRV